MEQYFKNLLGKSSKVTNKPFTKSICNQLDMKLEQFTQEEHDVVLRKIKNRKDAGLDEIPSEVQGGTIKLSSKRKQHYSFIFYWKN